MSHRGRRVNSQVRDSLGRRTTLVSTRGGQAHQEPRKAGQRKRQVLEGHLRAKEALIGPPASLPYQERIADNEWSPPGPRNLNMIDTNRIADNDVSGASLQRQGESRSAGIGTRPFRSSTREILATKMNLREAENNSNNRFGEVLLRPHRLRTPDGGEIGNW